MWYNPSEVIAQETASVEARGTKPAPDKWRIGVINHKAGVRRRALMGARLPYATPSDQLCIPLPIKTTLRFRSQMLSSLLLPSASTKAIVI